VTEEGDRITGYDLSPVSLTNWNLAKELLVDESIVEVPKWKAEELLGSTIPGTTMRHYLVRGSVSVPQEGQVEDAYREASKESHFSLLESGPNGVIILSVQIIYTPIKWMNVPMVLSIPRRLSAAYLGCWAMR
jgi:hypothetical protein